MQPEPAELIQRLRQQLILAQVRLMELEDERDETTPRLTAAEQLLGAAQALADRQAEAAAHLEKVRADLQAQYEHMRHMQHVTNEALTATRAELAAEQAAHAAARAAGSETAAARDRLELQLDRAREEILGLEHALQRSRAEGEARAGRIAELDAERSALKASRSWRWTAWLRALERALGRRP